MKVSLHNKFEITHNGKTYTAYNTLLKNVFNKISKLEQYTSHIAVGTGQNEVDFSAKKLTTYLRSFKATTEEINSNTQNGQLYIKKLVSIEDNSPDEFSFSELGICASDEFDPDIYNHVLLKDQNGEVVTINRRAGDNLQIRVTIYLELSVNGESQFTLGNNKLIARILGDDFDTEDNGLYALKGENLAENIPLHRTTPILDDAVLCTSRTSFTASNANITFSAELGEGATEELLLVFDKSVCMRLSTLKINPSKEEDIQKTCEGGAIVELGENVEKVNSVKNGESEEEYTLVKYSKKLTDKIENLFELPFDSQTPRYTTSDGSMIAFNYSGQIHLYKDEGGHFTKFNTTQLPSNIFKLFILKDAILILQTEAPYIRIFSIEGNSVIERTVNLNNYNLTVFPYSWLDAAATISNGIIILGLIINNEEKTPLVVRFSKSGSNIYYDNIARSTFQTVTKVFAIDENPFSDAMIVFLTNTYNGKLGYFMEEFYESISSLGGNSSVSLNLQENSVGLYPCSRAIYSQREVVPYLTAYYLPNYVYGGNELSSSTKHYFSKDGNYIIKRVDGGYTICNAHQEKKLIPFENNFPSFFNADDVKDFEFCNSMLLVFTTGGIYGIVIKKDNARLDGVSDSEATYDINLSRYDLPGSHQLEGVSASLLLSFNLGTAGISLVNNKLLSKDIFIK